MDTINADPPADSVHCGALLRMGAQLWTLERTALLRQQELSRRTRELAQRLGWLVTD